MPGPNEIDPPQPTPFEALVRRLAEEANTPETVTVDDLLNGGRFSCYYLERFARLVAEECAKLCDDMAAEGRRANSDFRSPHVGAMGEGAAECAEQIRAKFPAAKGSA